MNSIMPRLARLDAPGVIQHVMIRGIERRKIFQKIFQNNKDRNDMMDRLADLLPATNTICYAWAFLSNHAHFLFRSSDRQAERPLMEVVRAESACKIQVLSRTVLH